MKEEKKYPCEQCVFGIYTFEKKWRCDLYDMYAPQVCKSNGACALTGEEKMDKEYRNAHKTGSIRSKQRLRD